MYLVTCFQGYKDRLWSINSILELKQKLDLAKKKLQEFDLMLDLNL